MSETEKNPPKTQARQAETVERGRQKDEVAVGMTTLPSKEDGLTLARCLLDRKLVACAQIDSNILSVYEWNGQVCEDSECRLVLKFPIAKSTELEAAVHELHPYECPQWIWWKANAGEKYLNWVKEVCTL